MHFFIATMGFFGFGTYFIQNQFTFTYLQLNGFPTEESVLSAELSISLPIII